LREQGDSIAVVDGVRGKRGERDRDSEMRGGGGNEGVTRREGGEEKSGKGRRRM